MFHIYSEDANGGRIGIVFGDGQTLTVADSHPNFAVIHDLLRDSVDRNEAEVRRLADVATSVADSIAKLSDRVVLRGTDLYFDGDLIDKAITRHIVAMYRENDPKWAYLVAFLENLAANPSAKSRRHLYYFLDKHDFQITEDGHFIAYKGVEPDGRSIHAGYGIVDGTVYSHAKLPNEVGSVVEMPRSMVDNDRDRTCSVGLHAGTHSYASNFGHGRVMTVKINPRDVVSVPHDSNDQKLRVCRYVVAEFAPASPYSGTTWTPTETAFDLDDDGEDEDEWCGNCPNMVDECTCNVPETTYPDCNDECELGDCIDDECICHTEAHKGLAGNFECTNCDCAHWVRSED